jgi:aminoglycoside 6'-N-acetyltransferase
MIRGNKINLRPLTQQDLEFFRKVANDPEYNGEFNDFGLRNSVDLEKGFSVEGLFGTHHGMLVIVDQEGEIVGDMSYHQIAYGPNPASQVYEIGLSIRSDCRGRGYGVEAQALLADYFFRTYNVMRIQASTDIENIPEQKALAKAGFTREGVIRKAQWRNGAFHDLVMFSKLRGE